MADREGVGEWTGQDAASRSVQARGGKGLTRVTQ